MKAPSTFWYDKNELEALFERVRPSGVRVPPSEQAQSIVARETDPFSREACSMAVAGLVRGTGLDAEGRDAAELTSEGEEITFYTGATTAGRGCEAESADGAEAMSLFGREACSMAVAGLVRATAVVSETGTTTGRQAVPDAEDAIEIVLEDEELSKEVPLG